MTDPQPATPATVADQPGDPVNIMAQLLTGYGLTVRTTGREDSRLKITGTSGTACEITIDEDWYFTCETSTRHGHPASTGGAVSISGMAGTVARMLAIPAASPDQYQQLHQAVTPAGAVGREMNARGMTVTMKVWEDHQEYAVSAVIIITSPAQPERGDVHLDNNGWIHWECHGDQIAGGPADLAGTIADLLTQHTPHRS